MHEFGPQAGSSAKPLAHAAIVIRFMRARWLGLPLETGEIASTPNGRLSANHPGRVFRAW